MNIDMRAFLQSWDWRLEIISVLVSLGAIYAWGWYRLRAYSSQSRINLPPKHTRPDRARLVSGWGLAAYLGGLVVLGLALMSPLDVLGQQLFSMHMIQHLFLVMIVPPLLLLANPFPFLLWGLPVRVRRKMVALFHQGANFRRGLQVMTKPPSALILFIACLWIWHLPAAYDAALRREWIHDLEHLTFFITAMIYWWPVINAGPHIHKSLSHGVRIAYLLLTLPLSMVVGVVIALANVPIYTYYTTVPRLGGLTVLQDQMLGGLIMWVPGSMMYIIAALVLVRQILRDETNRSQVEMV